MQGLPATVRYCYNTRGSREGCRGGRGAVRQGCWERLYHVSIRKHTYIVSTIQYDDKSF